MKLRNWMIGAVVAGSISLGVGGVMAYDYVSKLNKELNTYVLPHTTFEGIALDGKTKEEVESVIQQHVDELNKQTISYSLQGKTSAYTWQDIGVEYTGTDIVDQIFTEQKGTLKDRYELRKKAQEGQLNRSYDMQASLNTAKYEEFMKDKYNDILVEPVNAAISIKGTDITITPSKDGQKVVKEQLTPLTQEAIAKGIEDIEVPVAVIKPEKTTEDIEAMGIQEVVVEFRTPLRGRNANQIFNVDRAADSLTDVFLAPDEVFSFNEHVGMTNAANGYKTAGVFVNGKLEQGAGGGVCQVSSTLYGALLRADLAIVERSNHSMPVGYIPLGQDATVADYGPDLKFQNNTGHHMYIQSFVDKDSMVVRIFGTNTGKKVDVSSQVLSETDKLITVATYKTVTQNGKVVESKQIGISKYKKAQA